MKARVVVIGGGAFGASCFYHLTAKGIHDVVLVEQPYLGQDRGDAHDAQQEEPAPRPPPRRALCHLIRRLPLPFAH